jgi:D-alanyl-D-alanine carboxypeptidase (penicillin-binding protein 5/6)
MMTSYVIGQEIEAGRLDPEEMVTISQNAWSKNYGDSSKMFIEVGKQVSVRDLNLGIIIQSGNDACIAMAEHLAGSEDAFANLMNNWAQYIGMKDSNFVNSHGLHDENHYSSAYDMAILGRALIHDLPDEYKIYSQKEFTFNGIKQSNRNRLLWDNTLHVDGIKTGHLSQVGYNLVTSAVDPANNFRLISVVIGANSERQRADDSKALLTYGFRFYKPVPVIKKGKPLIEQKIIYGDKSKVKLGSGRDITVAVPRNKIDNLKVSIKLNDKNKLEAPIKSGVEVGTIFIRTSDDELIHQAPLITLESVEEGGWLDKSWDWTVSSISDLFS